MRRNTAPAPPGPTSWLTGSGPCGSIMEYGSFGPDLTLTTVETMYETEPELTRSQIALLSELPQLDQAELAPKMFGLSLIECESVVASRRVQLERAVQQADDEAAGEERDYLRFWGI